nr:hypothetical protein [Glaciibacter superstes]
MLGAFTGRRGALMVQADAEVDNVASRRVLLKVGSAELIGRLRWRTSAENY